MWSDVKSIFNGIQEAVRKGIFDFDPEKIAKFLPLDVAYVQNFITMVLPAVIGQRPGLIVIWLVYSYLSSCRKKLTTKELTDEELEELKEEFRNFYETYTSVIQRWDGYITASGIKPLIEIIGNLNRERAETDKERFLAGLKPTYNVIIDNLDIKREKYDVIKKEIADGKNVLILGNSGSGKTVLMMRLAYDLMKEGWHCFIAQDSIDVQKALTFLRQKEFTNNSRVVFIDNAARYKDSVLSFINEIYQQSCDVKIVLVEQTPRWKKDVKENLAVYNFVVEEITLTDAEAVSYSNRYGRDKKFIPIARGVLPVLIFLQRGKEQSLEKAIDDFWNPLTEQEKKLMLPILIVSAYYLDYPREVFEGIYADDISTIAELEKSNIISKDDTWISTWHPFISQAIIKRISLPKQTVLTHICQLRENIPSDKKYQNFLFSFGTEILVHEEDSKDESFIDEGIQFLDRVLQLDPQDAEAYNNRGVAYAKKGEYDLAIEDFNKALELNPKYVEAYNNRGNAYGKKGEYDKAIADFTRVIELNPQYAEVYYTRGAAYAIKCEYELAIADFNKVIELNPKDARVYNNRGNAYAIKGEYDKAIGDFTKAIELNPKDAEVYYTRGTAYAANGDYDRAIADYNKAIELNPKYAEVMANLGGVYHKVKGDKEKAEFWYKEALKNKELLPDKGARVQEWLKELLGQR